MPRHELQGLVHDLRNHLNALLINAGVLSAACKDEPRLSRYREAVEREGEHCASMLSEVADRHLQDGPPALLR